METVVAAPLLRRLSGERPSGRDGGRGARIAGQRPIHPADGERRPVAPYSQRGRHVRLLAPHLQLGGVGGIPDLDRPVLGERDQSRTVGREREPHDRPLVGEPCLDHRVDLRLVPRDELPDADRIVRAAGHDEAAVGAEGAAVLLLERLGERIEPHAVGHAPDLARVVGTGADQEAAVGAERDVVDGPVMAAQRAQRRTAPGIPELDHLVVAAGGQGVAVGRELGVVEEVFVAREPAHDRPVLDLPDGRHTPQTRDSRRRHQQRAVAAEVHGRDLTGEVLKCPHRRIVRHGQGPGGPVQGDRRIAGDRQPAAVARGVERGDRPDLRLGRDPGHDQGQAIGLFTRRRPFRSGVDPRLQQGDLLGVGARLTLGRHRRLRQTCELADHPAGRGVAGADHRPLGRCDPLSSAG